MKRYVHPLKSFASTPNYVHLYCKPAVEYCEWTEVQALLRAVAEEARKMKHEEHCPAVICEECGCGKDRTWHVPSDDPDDYCRFSPEGDCECGRGKVLAMLEVA